MVEQGGDSFFIELETVPQNKIKLVKYLNAHLGLSVSEISENLRDSLGPKWVVYSSSNLIDISKIFVDLEELGSSPRVYSIKK